MRHFPVVPLVLACLAPAASAQVETRVVSLSGELLVLPAQDQRLPSGWRVECASTVDGVARSVEFRGLGELTLRDGRFESLVSSTLTTGALRIAIESPGQPAFEIGDTALAWTDEGASLRSLGADLTGRTAFELVGVERALDLRADGNFALHAELALSPSLAHELGIALDARAVIGALTLLGTPSLSVWPSSPASSPAAFAVTGPDVIVSNVGITISKLGSLSGVSSYAMTTTSCNIGDADAIWIDCTSGANCNQHPVIGQQMYRLATVAGSTRFEQLGLSWLKHGFCADDAPNCGAPYTPNPSCDWLGRFATDVYDYSLNANQAGAGARSEVQPWTGAYPYPPVLGAGQTGNVLNKRMQIRNSDLDPALNPGARYWGEVVYITTDEASAVRHNNYSTRELAVGSFFTGGWLLSFSAATSPQVSAIERWAQVDANVRLTVVDVPGDGRFILGSKVTSLGGGQHHYEYALFNMNSDRAGQGLAVPLATGIACTNVGFHDVDYHSGEPYSTTDWSSSIAPGTAVSWQTQTFAQNANANAVRWGTTYNYRFDCDAPPTLGAVTLTLFKPGTPTTLTILTDVPTGPPCSSVSYCTSGITTSGCTPTMSLNGVASASSASPALLTASGVEGQRTGILFVGFQQQASLWAAAGTSFLCITPPTARIPPPQSSGGTASQCDGVLTADINAFVQANSGLLLGQPVVAGLACNAQCWFRDPPAPKGTNLSNGLSFTFCP